MEKSEQAFLAFWEKRKENKWRFILGTGSMFGIFVTIVFAVRTWYRSGHMFNSFWHYLGSDLFFLQFSSFILVAGPIYGFIMYRYFNRRYKRIKDKYNE